MIPRIPSALAAALMGVSTSCFATTSVVLDSDAGDYIGLGIERVFSPPGDQITATFVPPGTIQVMVDGPYRHFLLSFDAPGAAMLDSGTYEHAVRYPFNEGMDPG